MTGIIQRVALIGAGKVARQMGRWMRSSGVEITQVYNRTFSEAENLAGLVGATAISDLSEIADVQMVIIAVSDDAIAAVSAAMPAVDAVVVHTSGTRPIEDLNQHVRCGVFYPLQTFTDDVEVDFRQVPVCIEGVDPETEELLRVCCLTWGAFPYILNSSQREVLHVAAVIANNFANHLWGKSFELLNKSEIEPDILFPLMMETVQKAIHADPHSVQTGPAVRGDKKTIERHLQKLKSDDNLQEIYRILTKSILEKQQHGKL